MTTGPDSAPRVDEQLSAWLDDELPVGELELLARRLAQGPELRARVARYALIGSCLRGSPAASLAGELSLLRLGDRVRAAVEGSSEPAPQEQFGRRIGRRSPYAIVAGVAVLGVALVPLVRMAIYPVPLARQSAESAVPQAVVTNASLSSDRMTSYLMYHGEYSGMLSAKVTDSNIINHRSFVVVPPLAGGASAR
jgi:negative regulator of sigma E activity